MSSDKYYKELQSLKYFDEEKLIEKIINESNWLNDEEISINAESIVEKCRSDRNKTKLDNFFLEKNYQALSYFYRFYTFQQ